MYYHSFSLSYESDTHKCKDNLGLARNDIGPRSETKNPPPFVILLRFSEGHWFQERLSAHTKRHIHINTITPVLFEKNRKKTSHYRGGKSGIGPVIHSPSPYCFFILIQRESSWLGLMLYFEYMKGNNASSTG